MAPEDNPKDDGIHAECAMEIHRLEAENAELRDILRDIVGSGVAFVAGGYSELQVSHEALRIANELLKGGE